MSRSRRAGPTATWLAGALAAATAGCGDAMPEDRLAAASEQLDEARGELSSARSDMDEARKQETRASAALREARRSLRDAERAVLSAEQRVQRRATDVALFRAVQSAMLKEPGLEKSAVEVRVDDAVVTLAGTASDERARERALALARSTTGVVEVRDQLDVEQGTHAASHPRPGG